ncbi:hypothetical protein DSCO28_67410 [Desulfosarcina ovata subsp. sediminis]|uniref:Uncharacterized protein n=1 Tax=Desulfosarcina ovata subsp. sediminis TaxID=885957 RepID=A0A5K8A0S3_9BACT|nr:hypothetical protein [Desulfosarcina ovata]BBO86175.1 hypothetical protein DSCO28_67410 [Desulfosarcina ovata subsp. sediminis]
MINGNLRNAVTNFLKAIQVSEGMSSSVWSSAQRLYYIYIEAGRKSEAKLLKELADRVNQGWGLGAVLGSHQINHLT